MKCLFPLFVCCLLAGCGSSGEPYTPIRVSGKVVYDDGSPIPTPGMQLIFDPEAPPLDAKTFPRKGVADVGADGTFSQATTFKPGDGLIPGKHRVTIFAPEGSGPQGGKAKLKIPKECSDGATTPLLVDTAVLPLEIKVPKPK
jgi:hypothetical protein